MLYNARIYIIFLYIITRIEIFIYFIISYLQHTYKENWRNVVGDDIFKFIIKNDLWNNIVEFTKTCPSKYKGRREYLYHFVEHFKFKTSQGRGVYHALPNLLKYDGKCPAVMFKMVQSCLHYDKDRALNMRELLHLMGHPHDYEMQGNYYTEYAKIGQNVPVRTAFWVVSEALKAYERNNDLEDNKQVRFFDNIKQEELKYVSK